MKRILLAAVIVSCVAAPAFAFDPRDLTDLTFVNMSGAKIQSIFLSASESELWGADLIGADRVLENGKSFTFRILSPESSYKYDILATDDTGRKLEVHDYVVSDNDKGRVYFTRANLDEEAPDFTLTTLEVTNRTGFEIRYLFFAAKDSDAWGADLLAPKEVIPNGGSHYIVVPVGEETATYYLMLIDQTGSRYDHEVKIDAKQGPMPGVVIDMDSLVESVG